MTNLFSKLKSSIEELKELDVSKLSLSDRFAEFFSSEENYRSLVGYLEGQFHKHYENIDIHKVIDQYANVKGYGGGG